MASEGSGSKSTEVAPAGFVVIDKPAGWTSHDVVGKLRRILGTRKVGHAGTLDPMATGVLVCGVGQATRLMGYVSDAGKEYEATIRLGVTTMTDDAEGEVVSISGASLAAVSEAEIEAGLAKMVGEIEQRPSSVSAIKVDGERAYAKVRRGESVELPARPVIIDQIVVHDLRDSTQDDESGQSVPVVDLDVTVTCSSGTYIRAIARDLGEALETGGMLTALRRTRVGEFTLADARSLETLAESPVVIELASVLPKLFATTTLDGTEATKFCHGGKVSLEAIDPQARDVLESGELLGIFAESGQAIGVAELRKEALAPKIVWPN